MARTRAADDAKPEDYLFPHTSTRDALAQRLEDAWNEATDALGLSLTFYEATRHSFVSRNLAHGASLDEVSAAIGHSSPVVTQRHYNHFVRRQFSAGIARGLINGQERQARRDLGGVVGLVDSHGIGERAVRVFG